jgi:hypothetical protein
MADFLVNLLSPAIVWIASWVVSLVKKTIPDSVMTGIIVPALAVAVSYLQHLVLPGSAPFMVSVLISLVSVFLQEFTKNAGRAISALWNGTPVPRMGDKK